ncbi:hypothetical protein K6W36_09590 [Acetobacter senegalensis]|uniref:hypothetical protein n=1 Tax=Acetobacter senegalensis TaxID=446692 RepID=UPI001EDB8595|nr:hypothetical protein [Acetobacter senegalensis]MCG4260836.1 hypothetical protein [Acetobacter senegalensis]
MLALSKENTMASVREKLIKLGQQSSCPPLSGELYQWLYKHHEAIAELRQISTSWKIVATVAADDGVNIGTSRQDLKKIECKWRVVCRAISHKQSKQERHQEQPSPPEPRSIMPSRLPADWTPEFVDIPQPAPPPVQPAPQSSSLTLKTETVPAGAPMTMEQKIDKARFTLGQAKFDLTLAKEQIRRNDSQGAPMLVKEVEAKLPELREIIKQRRAIYDRLLAGEDVPEAELEFKSPREREEEQYSS